MEEKEVVKRLQKIRNKRRELNLKQKEMISILSERGFLISLQSYQRLEQGKLKNYSKYLKALKEIENILEISEEDKKVYSQVSFKIPMHLLNKIEELKVIKNCNTTETLLFIIEEYFVNLNIFNAKYEIFEGIEQILMSTFIKELSKKDWDLKDYQELVKQNIDKSDDEIIKMKEKIRQDFINRARAKKY